MLKHANRKMENVKEREISMQELLRKIVFGWRRVLICMIIAGIVAVSYRYLNDLQNYKIAQNTAKQDVQVEYSYTEEEIAEIEEAKRLQGLLDDSKEYIERSVLMKINPYAVNILTMQYYVDSDYIFNYSMDNETDYTLAVTNAYSNFINNGDIAEKIIEELKLDCEISDIKELINATVAEKTFCIELVYPDEDVLLEMAEVIQRQMQAQTEGIAENIGQHSLKLLAQNIGVEVKTNIAAVQDQARNRSNSQQAQLNALKATMTQEQLACFSEDESVEETIITETATAVKPTINMKYFILGLIAGAFAAIVWIVCKVLFASSLQETSELVDVYGLRLLGTVEEEKKVSGIDKVILKFMNRHEKELSMEERIQLICSNIELVCQNENISQIYLSSSEMEHVDKHAIQLIMEGLSASGIEVILGKNICYDAAALKEMVEISNIVLLEQVGKSRYYEIEKEILIISEQKVRLLGCIGIQ